MCVVRLIVREYVCAFNAAEFVSDELLEQGSENVALISLI